MILLSTTMTQITTQDLVILRETHKDKKIVFCSGGFDLTHAGHVLFFEDCKQYGDILVVGIGGDAVRKKDKDDGRPIINEHMRVKLVSSLKPVDYAFIIHDLPVSHPLDALLTIMAQLRPDTYVINTDASHVAYREAMVKKTETKLVILDRVCPPEYEKVSTTGIIEKIKKLK